MSSLSVLHRLEHTETFAELYAEEKREEGIEVTWMRREGIKRGESKLASNHFLMCAPLSGLLRDVDRVIQGRGEGGRRHRWPGG